MSDKQLKDKAINIKGNAYVLVSDRINFFNETYKNGCIQTKMLSETDAEMVVIYAKVIPDIATPDRFFTGLSQAKWGDGMVNKTSAIENAETSAVGRALGMMGIGVIDSVASADEMSKAGVSNQSYASKPPEDDLVVPCKSCGSSTTYREGTTKTGKPYKAYFCNAKCGAKPYFVK